MESKLILKYDKNSAFLGLGQSKGQKGKSSNIDDERGP